MTINALAARLGMSASPSPSLPAPSPSTSLRPSTTVMFLFVMLDLGFSLACTPMQGLGASDGGKVLGSTAEKSVDMKPLREAAWG